MRTYAGGERPGKLCGGVAERVALALHHHVQLARVAVQQQVAHGAPHQGDSGSRERQQLLSARLGAQPLQQVNPGWRAHDLRRPHRRTGMPACTRCSLASPIVCRP